MKVKSKFTDLEYDTLVTRMTYDLLTLLKEIREILNKEYQTFILEFYVLVIIFPKQNYITYINIKLF